MHFFTEEEILKQFDENTRIKKYLETGPTEMYDRKQSASKKPKPAKATKTGKKTSKFDDSDPRLHHDDEEDDIGEDVADVAADIFDAVQKKVMKLINMKAVEKAFNMELQAQCKKYGVDESEVAEIIQDHIRDTDIEDLGITDILFFNVSY